MSLPGVTTIINDRFYTLSRTDIPSGPKVLVLGTRLTPSGTGGVSDLDPYNASNEATVISTFGEGSQLHRGYLECVSGGAQRVILVALPSNTEWDHSTGTITSDATTSASGASIPAFTGDELFDAAFAAVEASQADIVVPWGRGSNSNDNWGLSDATPNTEDELGFHADNATGSSSWLKKISDKMASITNQSYPCFAVLGVAPFTDDTSDDGGMTPAQVGSHLSLPNLVDRASSTLTNGIYVTVVAAEIEPLGYNNHLPFGYSNGAAMYAGYVSQLDAWSAPTGKSIFNVKSIRYNPTKLQQIALTDKGVIPVALNFNRVPTWVDGNTFGKVTSDYVRLTSLRIVFDAVQLVRQVSSRFIGEGTSIEHRNALETAITAGLRGMQQLGALLASDFKVTYVPAENKATVDLVLTPAFELRNITVSVSINL